MKPTILSSRVSNRHHHGGAKKVGPTNSDTNLPQFCFPNSDSLLCMDKGVSIDFSKKIAVKSPYELQDNQYIFQNRGLYNSRDIRTAIYSPRISKSPPPHTSRIPIPSQNPDSNLISIENFNPYVFPQFTEPATIEAMESLNVKPSDLYYQINASEQLKATVNSTIKKVKIERERILANKSETARSTKAKKRTYSPPQRFPIPETFSNANCLYGFIPCNTKNASNVSESEKAKLQHNASKVQFWK